MPADDAPNSTPTGAPTPAAGGAPAPAAGDDADAAPTPAAGDDDDTALRRLAQRRAGAKLAFYKHLAAYVLVNVALLAINLATSPGTLWFYWPLLGWGVAIAAHAARVYRVGRGPGLRQRLEEAAPGGTGAAKAQRRPVSRNTANDTANLCQDLRRHCTIA